MVGRAARKGCPHAFMQDPRCLFAISVIVAVICISTLAFSQSDSPITGGEDAFEEAGGP